MQFSPYLGSLSRVRNQYFRFWDLTDGAAIIADVLFLTVIAVTASLVIDRLSRPLLQKIYRHMFVIALGSGVIANLPPIHFARSTQQEFLWFVLVAITGYSFGNVSSSLVRRAATSCLVLSPVILIVMGQMLFWRGWTPNSTPVRVTARSRPGPSTPVFMFVFDEWSYSRSTRLGEFLTELPNLRRLASQSIYFRKAYSPSTTTYRSLPMLIYQTDQAGNLPGAFVRQGKREWVNEGEVAWQYRDGVAPQSLFGLTRESNYETYLLGFYLPYADMLHDQVDYCRSFPFYPKGSGFFKKMEFGMLESMRYWGESTAEREWRNLYNRAFVQHWFDLQENMDGELERLITECPDNTFAFIHWPLPHAPFIFNSDGSHKALAPVDYQKAKDDDEDRMNGSPEQYLTQLEYLDLFIGKVIDRLKTSAKFDSALLLITSDHSWRNETDSSFLLAPRAVQRVPLIVKLPGQNAGSVVDSEVSTVRLRSIINQALRGDSTDNRESNMLTAVRKIYTDDSSTFR